MMTRLAIVGLLVACSSSARAPTSEPAPVVTPAAPPPLALHVNVIEGDEPTILLEAGGAADSTSWKTFPDELARATGKRVITYDRAGLGKSPFPTRDFTVVDEVDALHASLTSRGIKRVVIVAESYGAMIAVSYVQRHADTVAGLVLLDPMNADFIDAVGLATMMATVPKIDEPKTDRERAIVHMASGLEALVGELRGKRWPASVPAVIVSAGIPPWPDEKMRAAWRASHESLAKTGGALHVVAERSEHRITKTEPDVVIDAVKRVASR